MPMIWLQLHGLGRLPPADPNHPNFLDPKPGGNTFQLNENMAPAKDDTPNQEGCQRENASSCVVFWRQMRAGFGGVEKLLKNIAAEEASTVLEFLQTVQTFGQMHSHATSARQKALAKLKRADRNVLDASQC